MEVLESLAPLANISAVGALVLVLVLLFRAVSAGAWVPRRELDYLRDDRDARVLEKEREAAEWRAAYETERTARALDVLQKGELIEAVRAQDRFLDALRALAEGRGYVDPT